MKKVYLLFVAVILAACSAEPVENEGISGVDANLEGKKNQVQAVSVEEVGVEYVSEYTFTNPNGKKMLDLVVSNDCTHLQLKFTAPENKDIEVSFDIFSELPELKERGGDQPSFLQDSSITLNEEDLDENGVFEISFQILGVTSFDDIFIFAKKGNDMAGDEVHGGWNYFTYDITEEICEEPVQVCESAYAKGDIDLIDFYPQTKGGNNWGWAAKLNLAEGETKDFEIWAAAGKNETSKGLHVGTATVDYNGEITTTLFSPYTSNEIHVLVADELPAKRPGPGKYGDYKELNADGNFYLIVHMNVCWEE